MTIFCSSLCCSVMSSCLWPQSLPTVAITIPYGDSCITRFLAMLHKPYKPVPCANAKAFHTGNDSYQTLLGLIRINSTCEIYVYAKACMYNAQLLKVI